MLPRIITRTTRTPAFWGYPPPPQDYHTIESYWISSQKKTKSKLQIYKIRQNFKFLKFWNGYYMQHTFWSCLIRCASMKWIRWVLLKIQSGHDSVHRWTDGQGNTSILPFQLRWSGGYNYCIRLQFSTLSWHVHNCDLTEPLESKSEQWFKPKSFMKIWIGNWIHMSNWYKIYSITEQSIIPQRTHSCVAGYSTS